MKKLVVSMLVMLTVAFFGCASADTPEAQPAPAPAEKVTETEAAPAEEVPVQEESEETKEAPEATTDSSGSE